MLIGLEVPFNLTKCIVRGMDGEVIVTRLCKSNLSKINFAKVYGAYAAHLI